MVVGVGVGDGALAAEGVVVGFVLDGAGAAGDDAGGAEMVGAGLDFEVPADGAGTCVFLSEPAVNLTVLSPAAI